MSKSNPMHHGTVKEQLIRQGVLKPEVPTMRLRLIETLLANQGYAWFGRECAEKLVDVILSEIRKPTEGMITAAGNVRTSDRKPGNPNNYRVRRREYWQAMVDYVRTEDTRA